MGYTLTHLKVKNRLYLLLQLGQGGTYNLAYSTGDHSRQETRTSSGQVSGNYVFSSPEGAKVQYNFQSAGAAPAGGASAWKQPSSSWNQGAAQTYQASGAGGQYGIQQSSGGATFDASWTAPAAGSSAWSQQSASADQWQQPKTYSAASSAGASPAVNVKQFNKGSKFGYIFEQARK